MLKQSKPSPRLTVGDAYFCFKQRSVEDADKYTGYEETVSDLPVVKNVGVARTNNELNIYASGKLYEVIKAMTGAEISLGTVGLPYSLTAKALGEEELQGFYIGSATDIPNEFAFGYYTQYRNGKYYMRWMPHCVLSKADDSPETSTESPTEPKDEYTLLALVGDDGNWKVDYDQNSAPNGTLITLEMFFAKPLTAKADVEALLAEQALPVLTVVSSAGSSAGNTAITVTPALTDGNSYKYKTGASPVMPSMNQDCSTSTWKSWDGNAEIAAVTGEKIIIVEVDSGNLCKKAGITTVTAMA